MSTCCVMQLCVSVFIYFIHYHTNSFVSSSNSYTHLWQIHFLKWGTICNNKSVNLTQKDFCSAAALCNLAAKFTYVVAHSNLFQCLPEDIVFLKDRQILSVFLFSLLHDRLSCIFALNHFLDDLIVLITKHTYMEHYKLKLIMFI